MLMYHFCPSFYPSVRYCVETVVHIVKLYSIFWYRPNTSSFDPNRRYKIPKVTPSAGAQNTLSLRGSSKIFLCFGNGTRWARGYHRSLIGS